MNTLISLTMLGSIGTLLLVRLKGILLGKYGGSWYYYIWILVLLSFCFPYKLDIFQEVQMLFNGTGQGGEIDLPMMIDDFMYATGVSVQGGVQQGDMVPKEMFNEITMGKMISMVYGIGVFFLSMYYASSYLIFRKKIKTMTREVTNEGYEKCLQKCCLDMKISKKITLKESAFMGAPMLVGLIKPTILLPAKKIELGDVRLMLQHELTHYKRRDILYKFFALLVHILHWFNPFSYMALRNINEACEYACDEAVTKGMTKERKRQYGYMLLNQIQSAHLNESSLFSMHLCRPSKHKNVLERRLRIIMNNKKYKYLHITMYAVLSLVLCSNFFNLQSIKGEMLSVKNEEPQGRGVYLNTPSGGGDRGSGDAMELLHNGFAKTMTQEELIEIYNFVDNGENNIDKGTRSLTTAENERLVMLREQYLYDGFRPEKSLPLSKDHGDFYFDIKKEVYVYPQRELTEEELLQLIDWRLKVNYALSLRTVASNGAEPSGREMREGEAIGLASAYIEKVFDVSVNDFHMGAEFHQGEAIQPHGWFVRLSPKASTGAAVGDWNYAVWIKSLEEIEISRSSPTHQATVPGEREIATYTNDFSWIEKAKSIVAKVEKEPIKGATYMDTADKLGEKRTVDVQVDMENGTTYVVSLLYPDKTLKGIIVRK